MFSINHYNKNDFARRNDFKSDYLELPFFIFLIGNI